MNQKAILKKYAEDNGFRNIEFYVDDGVSGTTFDRPDFNRMIADVESGRIGTIIIKDMSRFGSVNGQYKIGINGHEKSSTFN